MTDKIKIERADATVNAINGCSVVSRGCNNCYAMRSGARNLLGYPSTGLTKPSKAGHVWTGEVRLSKTALLQPLKWKKPRRIFWNAHGDMFHENVPDVWIDRCFAVMALTPQHTHMVLTKRPERMLEYFSRIEKPQGSADALGNILDWMDAIQQGDETHKPINCAGSSAFTAWPLPNGMLGVSAEDQEWADQRIPTLLATPAAKRFLSLEPLLGPIDLSAYLQGIDLVIVGGESGRGSRPMHPDWVRSIRDQCAGAAVPFMFKQWGDWIGLGVREKAPSIGGTWPTHGERCVRLGMNGERQDGGLPMQRVGKKFAGCTLDGVLHDGVA